MVDRSTGSEPYYSARAAEFDRVYTIPERQSDLRTIAGYLVAAFAGFDVLEVAAGTGYWTQFFADEAQSVVATDVNESMLSIARSRRTWPSSVVFTEANAYALDQVPGEFNACFVGFLWSHVGLQDLDELLAHITGRLKPGGRIVFVDNRRVSGSGTPVARFDDHGNGFQVRTLDDGSVWEVMKNYPTADELHERLDPLCAEVRITTLEYFWIADARTGRESEAPRPG